jgi:cation transport ATPase
VAAQAHNGWSKAELLRLLGSMERGSSHPLAAAILGYAAAQVGGWVGGDRS